MTKQENNFELDIDRERVFVEGEWLSVDDLASRIKQMIEAGDFHVSHLSLALESLETGLRDIKSVEFKMPPEVLKTYERLAQHEAIPITKLFRRALIHYLSGEQASRQLYESNLRAQHESTPPQSPFAREDTNPGAPGVTISVPPRELPPSEA